MLVGSLVEVPMRMEVGYWAIREAAAWDPVMNPVPPRRATAFVDHRSSPPGTADHIVRSAIEYVATIHAIATQLPQV